MCAAHGASGGHAGHKRQENLKELSEALINVSATGEDICGNPLMSMKARGLIVKSSHLYGTTLFYESLRKFT